MHEPVKKKADILHLEACNFIDKPMGGQLNFSRQLIKTMGNRLALVGLAGASSDPIGCWFMKDIDGTVYRYFALGRDDQAGTQPLIPGRVTTLMQIRRYRKSIFSIGIPNIILREHSILMGMDVMPGLNVCFYNPGVDSPLSISRYQWAKIFSHFFDKLFFWSLTRKANCILAAADDAAIADFKRKAGGALDGRKIIAFPTRVDTEIFHQEDLLSAREKLSLPADAIIAVTVGRIHWAKGWLFLLESFKVFLERHPNALLIFIGDGADRDALHQKALDLGIANHVLVVGSRPPDLVAAYLQAADIFVMGSFKEGWSTSLVEAMACHVPIVTTRFSSADTIVRDGVNGFIVDPRDATAFSKAMENALCLPDLHGYINGIIDRYALKNLKHDLFQVWPLV